MELKKNNNQKVSLPPCHERTSRPLFFSSATERLAEKLLKGRAYLPMNSVSPHEMNNSHRFIPELTANCSNYLLTYLLTYCPSFQRQLGQQQILSISDGLEPVSVRFPMNVPWLSPLPQQYVSMSSLDARVFCVPLVSIRLLLLGWSLDLCVIYGLSISSVYV